MNKSMNYCPNLLESKILLTIDYLNKLSLYPNSTAIYKILKGILDEETKPHINCPTFQTVISLPKKKISLRIAMLLRHGFLNNKFSFETEEMYLEISEKGKVYIFEYLKKHKNPFKKKIAKTFKNIVKI